MDFLSELKCATARLGRSNVRGPRRAGGFSLVELVMMIMVFSIISVAFLANYNAASKKIAIDTEAERVGQVVREAQVLSMSTLGVVDNAALKFTPYGLFVERNNDTFILFADKDNDGQYDASGGCGQSNSECVREQKLGGNVRLSKLCGTSTVVPNADVGDCTLPFKRANRFTLLFKKYADIMLIQGKPITGTDVDYTSAVLTLTLGNKLTRTVSISAAGQVVIQ